MMHKNEELAPLPGVWQTIAAGFDLTTKHLWLLILPVLLDAFLWLGPRLSSHPIFEQTMKDLSQLAQNEPVPEIVTQFFESASQFNLFTALSVPFIGIPVFITPVNPPLPVQVTEIADPIVWMGLFLLFSIIGILITAVYFTLISQTIRFEENRPALSLLKLINRAATTWLKLLGLGIIIAIAGLFLFLPLMLIAFVTAFISQFLAMLVLFIGPILILWLLIFTYFVPHDLTLYGHPLHIAVTASIQLVRIYFSPVLTLLIVILIIRNFLSSLLLFADDGSWLTGVGIIGHAFVMTSLTTATFLFFRDRYVAIAEKQRQLRQQFERQINE